MKKLSFTLLLVFSCFLAQAGGNKLYETKVTATPRIAFGGEKEMMIIVGSKNFNVINPSDGKMLLDKTYKEAGTSIGKANDAAFTSTVLVVCDDKNVSCIDLKNGSKQWENTSFTDLSAGNTGALYICGNYVLVSDKKGKDNFTLTCLNLNDGKSVWTIENQKNKVLTGKIQYIPDEKFFAFISDGKVKQINLVELATGKIAYSSDLEGNPIYLLADEESGDLFVHHLVSESNAYVTALSLKEGKYLWKTKVQNKSTHTPMVMNTDEITYYATMDAFENKVLLKTEGVEVFDIATGNSLYNIPMVPYYKWGVGHYINGIFEPEVTPYGILVADRTSGDLYMKMYNKNNGSLIWTTDKLKKKECAPHIIITGKSAAVQFGGLNYFEVINNGNIGKLLGPFEVISFDMQTGKTNWTYESKQDFYYIDEANESIMIVGKDKFQTINPQSGAEIKSDKNPFGDDYFMTKFTIGSYHKVQKDVGFDFSSRTMYRFEGNKLTKYSF